MIDYIISGGIGFIGKNLACHLSDTKKTFKILDKLCGCNVCDGLNTLSQPECKTFVHLAAFTNVRESLKRPVVAINSNITGLTSCLDFARLNKANFIYTSSMGAPSSMSPYTASKYAGEFICNAYREAYGLNATVLRLSNVYGPHSKHKGSVVSAFIKRCCDMRDIEIFGNGLQTRDFVHVDDVCKTILKRPKKSLIRVASGKTTSIIELAEIIRDLSDKLLNFRPNIKWSARIRGEVEKVGSDTDIKATMLLEDGLRSTFEWFKEHYSTIK